MRAHNSQCPLRVVPTNNLCHLVPHGWRDGQSLPKAGTMYMYLNSEGVWESASTGYAQGEDHRDAQDLCSLSWSSAQSSLHGATRGTKSRSIAI